jgi:hypothetical protein
VVQALAAQRAHEPLRIRIRPAVKLASRSCRTNFTLVPASSRSISRFLACCTTHDWTGFSKISASFHRDSRRDSPISDMTRDTTRKTSFKPTSRRSSHLRTDQDRPGQHRERLTEIDRVPLAYAQVAQIFGTHRL